MPYTSSTASSRNRARAVADSARAAEKSGQGTTLHSGTAKMRKGNSNASKHSRAHSCVHDNSQTEKRVRIEALTARQHHNDREEEEEQLRLSQELTSQCEAVEKRVHALLERSQMQEENANKTLRASLERSPLRHSSRSPRGAAVNTLSPSFTSSGKNETGSLARLSGLFGTPQVPEAPPPTPTRPDAVESAVAVASGWINKILGKSPDLPRTPAPNSCSPPANTPKARKSSRSPRPADGSHSGYLKIPGTCSPPPMFPIEQTSNAQQLVGGGDVPPPPSPSPSAESPRRSRKSVVFKEMSEVVTARLPELTEKAGGDSEPEARASVTYPPAPPPSMKKKSRQRSVSSSDEDEGSHAVIRSDGLDIGAFIREHSQARALRDLKKTDLMEYARQHHVTLSTSSTKKEILEVARRLAKGTSE